MSNGRLGMTYEKLIQQMDDKLQFPGLSNTWTMPVENRLDMELTGIKTPLGMKVQGPNVDGIQQLSSQIQNCFNFLIDYQSCDLSLLKKVAQGFLYQRRCQPAGSRALRSSRLPMCRPRSRSGIGGQNVAERIA